ncbi:MAG: T9SS type A sorting domain-containing protein, partial [Bacteroidia bacterium]
FFDDPAALAVKEIDNVDLVIYPNPSKGVFNLSSVTKAGKNYTVSVFDVVGNTVKKFDWNGNRTIIDLSNSPKGVYVVKISNDKETEVKKLIVQ